MKSPVESGLRQGLRELADAPAPPDMADRALRGARSVRRRRRWLALSCAGVLIVAAVAAVPFLGKDPPVDEVPPRAVQSGCPSASTGWPAFVERATTKLLPGSSHVMRFGYGVCPHMSPAPDAYAVIDVGAERGNGRLTMSLYNRVDAAHTYVACASFGPAADPPQPTDRPAFCEEGVRAVPEPVYVSCDALGPAHGPPPPPADRLLFCQKGTATAPTAFGVDHDAFVTVTAIYPDGRAVSIRSSAPAIGIPALRAVVTDRALANLLPARR